MKKQILFFLSFFLTTAIFAQIDIVEEAKTMSAGINNGFTLILPSDNTKTNLDLWKKLMKKYKGKTKYNKKTGEVFTDNANIDDMSDNDVDVYAKIDGNQITVWYDLGGAYLNSLDHNEKYPAAELIFENYYNNVSKLMAENDLKMKEKKEKELEKELKKLEKENKKYHETIEKAKKMIAEAEKGIEENLANQETKKNEIESQTSLVEEAKNILSTFSKKNRKRK